MCIVDVWLLYKIKRSVRKRISTNQFELTFAEHLLHNKYDLLSTRSDAVLHEKTDMRVRVTGTHLTQTSRKHKPGEG